MKKLLTVLFGFLASSASAQMLEFRPIDAIPVIVKRSVSFGIGCTNTIYNIDMREAAEAGDKEKMEHYGNKGGCMVVFPSSAGVAFHVEVGGYLLVQFSTLTKVSDPYFPLFLWMDMNDMESNTSLKMSGQEIWENAMGR